MPANIVARARVKLTIEIDLPGSWDASCPISQVHEQAVESARGWLGKKLSEGRFTIIGEPIATAIMASKE